MHTRWDGAVNAARVAPGLYRMGRREWLTEQGWREARADGVRTVVDLRGDAERARRPTDPGVSEAALAGVEVLLLPTEDPGAPEFAAFRPYLDSPACYDDYLGAFGDRVAAAVLAVARADGGVIVHCSAGRDRTGLVIALGQLVAGVPSDQIVDGWVRAAEGINAHHEHHHHPREGHLTGPDWDAFLRPRVAALRSFLGRVDAVALLRGHGADDADIAAVRRRFGA